VTRNGSAWYMGTQLDDSAMDVLVGKLADESGVDPPLSVPAGVEAVQREGDDKSFLFLLNHNAQETTVALDETYRDELSGATHETDVKLEPYGVAVLRAA
jgi:beta-galactosidase